jgi:uncharacterized protein YqhQ
VSEAVKDMQRTDPASGAEPAPPEACGDTTDAAAVCGFDPTKPIYGGQAVIEGVMMRGKRFAATAVRREDGDIVLRREAVDGIIKRHPWLNKPLLRGGFAMVDGLVTGIRSLWFSGDVMAEEVDQQAKTTVSEGDWVATPLDDVAVRVTHNETGLSTESRSEATTDANTERALRLLRGKLGRHLAITVPPAGAGAEASTEASDAPPADGPAASPDASPPDSPALVAAPGLNGKPKADELQAAPISGSPWAVTLMVLTMMVAVFIVIAVPHWLRKPIVTYLPELSAYQEQWGPVHVNFGANVVEGVLRFGLFLAYVWIIGFLPDIRRVFQYHGAEHKTVHGVEAGAPMTVEGMRHFACAHPRCGTNFIVIVICVKIVLFSFLEFDHMALRILARLALLPVVAAIAYEILRLFGRFRTSILARAMMAPGLWMQRLTTREPDDRQIEVAIRAMQETIALETEGGEASA